MIAIFVFYLFLRKFVQSQMSNKTQKVLLALPAASGAEGSLKKECLLPNLECHNHENLYCTFAAETQKAWHAETSISITASRNKAVNRCHQPCYQPIKEYSTIFYHDLVEIPRSIVTRPVLL